MVGGPGHATLTAFLKRWPQQLAAKPKQILVISGHWEVSPPGFLCACKAPDVPCCCAAAAVAASACRHASLSVAPRLT